VPKPKIYDGLIAVFVSAAAAVAAVFGLFNSLLSDLVPPFDDSQQTVGIASFGTAVVLLALTLAMRKRISLASARTIAATSVVLFVLALVVFFSFRDLTRTYVYRYPPASNASTGQTKHIRGDIHAAGLVLVRDATVAQAVYRLGGPDVVSSTGVLWHEDSRITVIGKLERMYVALTMLLTSAIFVAGVAVWRKQSA
jgi:hypothetical protein